jgi:hypothetical protein
MSDTPIADFVEAQPAPADAISFHKLAEAFPLLGEGELAELADDIRQHGLREPITLYHGAILDGRNRYRACKVPAPAPGAQSPFDDQRPGARALGEARDLPRDDREDVPDPAQARNVRAWEGRAGLGRFWVRG